MVGQVGDDRVGEARRRRRWSARSSGLRAEPSCSASRTSRRRPARCASAPRPRRRVARCSAISSTSTRKNSSVCDEASSRARAACPRRAPSRCRRAGEAAASIGADRCRPWKMSSGVGSLVFAFFCAARKISLSRAIAASSALIDRSRPTKSWLTMCGKTMMSRSGRSGRSRLRFAPGCLVVVSCERTCARSVYPAYVPSAAPSANLDGSEREGQFATLGRASASRSGSARALTPETYSSRGASRYVREQKSSRSRRAVDELERDRRASCARRHGRTRDRRSASCTGDDVAPTSGMSASKPLGAAARERRRSRASSTRAWRVRDHRLAERERATGTLRARRRVNSRSRREARSRAWYGPMSHCESASLSSGSQREERPRARLGSMAASDGLVRARDGSCAHRRRACSDRAASHRRLQLQLTEARASSRAESRAAAASRGASRDSSRGAAVADAESRDARAQASSASFW